jgi:hypothetical protein
MSAPVDLILNLEAEKFYTTAFDKEVVFEDLNIEVWSI